MLRPIEIRTSDPKKPMTLAEVEEFSATARAAGAAGDAPIKFENTLRQLSRAISTTVTLQARDDVGRPTGLETKEAR